MMTDPIADMLTRIRNASMVKKHVVLVPYSNLKYSIAKLFEREGFVGTVTKVEAEGERPMLQVALKYVQGNPRITEITRVSKPGLRVYVPHKEIERVCNGYGISILSTPQGLMTGHEAQQNHLGGELMCTVE